MDDSNSGTLHKIVKMLHFLSGFLTTGNWKPLTTNYFSCCVVGMMMGKGSFTVIAEKRGENI